MKESKSVTELTEWLSQFSEKNGSHYNKSHKNLIASPPPIRTGRDVRVETSTTPSSVNFQNDAKVGHPHVRDFASESSHNKLISDQEARLRIVCLNNGLPLNRQSDLSIISTDERSLASYQDSAFWHSYSPPLKERQSRKQTRGSVKKQATGQHMLSGFDMVVLYGLSPEEEITHSRHGSSFTDSELLQDVDPLNVIITENEDLSVLTSKSKNSQAHVELQRDLQLSSLARIFDDETKTEVKNVSSTSHCPEKSRKHEKVTDSEIASRVRVFSVATAKQQSPLGVDIGSKDDHRKKVSRLINYFGEQHSSTKHSSVEVAREKLEKAWAQNRECKIAKKVQWKKNRKGNYRKFITLEPQEK